MIWHLLQMYPNIWLTRLIQKGKVLQPTLSLFPRIHLLHINTSGSFLFEAQMKFASISFYCEEKQQESTFWLLNVYVQRRNQLPHDSTADSFTGFTCYYSKKWEPKTNQTPDEAWHFTMAHGLSLHLTYNNPCTPSRTVIQSYISVFMLFSSLLILFFGFPLLDFSFYSFLVVAHTFFLFFRRSIKCGWHRTSSF